MNSLKAELTKMAQAAENKKCQGELAGESKSYQVAKLIHYDQ